MSDDKNKQTLTQWQETVYTLAKSKGWWDGKDEEELDAERELAVIAMLHVALSHTLERVRKGKLGQLPGWDDDPRVGLHRAQLAKLAPRQVAMLAKLALIHSEVTEAVEAVLEGDEQIRIGENGKPEGVAIEVADAIIRGFDFCGGYGFDVSEAIAKKHAYNTQRSHKHGGKLA